MISVRDPDQALELSAKVLRREGFRIADVDAEHGLVRTGWRFAQQPRGEGFLYYRYVVEQPRRDGKELIFRAEVIRCEYAPSEGEDWGRSGCKRMAPHVPPSAEAEHARLSQTLKGVHGDW